MTSIDYRPSHLTFEQFHPVDVECFPDEPLDSATLSFFLRQDFWAAFDRGTLVGYCGVHRKTGFAWLRRVAVARIHRRQGVGRALMTAAIQHCCQIGLPEVMLYVQDDNLPAIHLYETFSFAREESTWQYCLPLSMLSQEAAAQSSADLRITAIDEVPAADLPGFPKQWADIRSLHAPPAQFVLIFREGTGRPLGYCRLTPGFPGCFPFVIERPAEYLLPALRALRKYLLPDREVLKLTISDPVLSNTCESLGIPLNYRLLKMVRHGQATGVVSAP